MAQSKHRVYDVQCHSCRQSFHETTELFAKDDRPNGAMFRLKEPYRSNKWGSFPETQDVHGGRLECPGCGFLYVDHLGNLKAFLIERDDPANERYLLIRKLRREGVSYEDISKQLGLAKSYVHRIDKEHIGRKKPC
jgi:hypothetical protein